MADSTTSPAEMAGILRGIIGRPTGNSKAVVERGPVSHFAAAVGSTSPIYRDQKAAEAAGFRSIPAPPTWPVAMDFCGKFEEMQPAPPPTSNPMMAALGPLMASGGLLLHGEQEFIYHRPIEVGDVLLGEGTITDAYRERVQGQDDDLHRQRDQLERRKDRRTGRHRSDEPDPSHLALIDTGACDRLWRECEVNDEPLSWG